MEYLGDQNEGFFLIVSLVLLFLIPYVCVAAGLTLCCHSWSI